MTTEPDFDAALARADAAVREGRTLNGTGFWPVVARLRANSVLAVRYGERVADIDRRAFERAVRVRVRIGVGVPLLVAGTAAGVLGLVVAAGLGDVLQAIVFGIAFVLLVVSTHSLGHYVVGRLAGIRFTHAFVAGRPPEPGVKIDYASYLRATPRRRAAMHASGALVTKIVPFALVPMVFAVHAWPGLAWILIAFGAIGIFTDVAFSTKTSDWMRVKRELRAGRSL